MSEERVSTGIDGLDAVIEGGFSRGSLILLAGSPGVGKTVFGATFFCRGLCDLDEAGVYASFAEDAGTFVRNMSRHLGRDYEKCIKSGKCRFLDFVTVKEEGISTILELILAEVEGTKAKRLVIDSYSAMAQAFREKMDARIVAHTILGKLVRKAGCTTILISEAPRSREQLGMGVEEFVADGVILLRAGELDGRLLRDLEIVKLRGTPLPERRLVFTLSGGFKAFPPFQAKPMEKPERFKPIPDPPEKFSTGVQELDRLLDGGFPKGSTVLIEIDEQISTFQYHLIFSPTPWSFLAKGRAVMVIPSSGVDHNIIKKSATEAGFTEDEINRLLRVCTFGLPSAPKEPYIARFGGKSIEEDYQRYLKIEEELMNETGQPVLSIVGADSIIAHYGKETVMKVWNRDATRIREKGSLGILVLKPGYAELPLPIADMHLKVTREHGALILYGVKPRTSLHAVEMDVSEGCPLPKLTPII